MRLVEGVDLKKWFDEYVGLGLGLNPTSTSPQPVHVLNGFWHKSLTGRRTTRLAADLVATKDGTWVVSQDSLRSQADGKVGLPERDVDLDQLRRAVSSMVATDRAVFINNHSFQVAHIGLVSSDTVHFGLGSLSANLALSNDVARELVVRSVRRLLEPQPNPHWGLQRALIDESISSTWEIAEPVDLPNWLSAESTSAYADHLTDLLIRCLELLASDCDSLLALQVLANATTWVGLLAYSQVPSLTLNGALSPILLQCSSPGDLHSLRDSSSQALIAAHLRFEDWLASGLRDRIREDFPAGSIAEAQVAHFLETTTPYSLSGGSKTVKSYMGSAYSGYRASEDAETAAANTLRDLLVTGMGNKHRSWCHAVGRHCGFIGPRRGRVPRVRAEISLLPTLVLAGMPRERTESMLMSDWLDELGARFGIAVGPSDLARSLNPRATEEDLEQNQTELSRLLVSIGLARRYSDGVTEILDPRSLWMTK